jgi:hypothetical protein
MVQLDYQLLYDARRQITGANVHRVKEMIFVYEQAVDLHNHSWGSHRTYQSQHETRLRCYVELLNGAWLFNKPAKQLEVRHR